MCCISIRRAGVESVDVVEYHGPFEIGVGVGVFVRGGYVMGMDGA